MLRCASAYTYDIDNAKQACSDIRRQLDEQIELLEHTLGIIMCHTEFIVSGALKAVCDSLPFDTIGMTTAVQAVNGESGELILTLFVMTSDDIVFKTGVTDGLEHGITAPVNTAYTAASAGNAPALVLAFAPFIRKYSGDAYVNAWRVTAWGAPVFGAVATDDTRTNDLCETIYNGSMYKTEMPFALCYGNIRPRFVVGTFLYEKSLPHRGVVTKSCGSAVNEINNANAYTYFENLGYTKNGFLTDNYILMPFVADQMKRGDYDGIPVIRGFHSFTEDGSAVFLGDIDEGSVISLLANEPEDVLTITRQKAQELSGLPDVNGVLIFTCIARRLMTLAISPLAELECLGEAMREGLPFMAGYAGGEMSPTRMRDGVPTNRFHNYSLIALVL